jgi:hypothetical protein
MSYLNGIYASNDVNISGQDTAYLDSAFISQNLITGTYGSVGLYNAGDTELQNVVIDGKVSIGKANSTTYQLDVSGNINASNYYIGGVSLSSLTGYLSSNNTWVGLNTFTALLTSTGNMSLTNQNSILTVGNPAQGTLLTSSWIYFQDSNANGNWRIWGIGLTGVASSGPNTHRLRITDNGTEALTFYPDGTGIVCLCIGKTAPSLSNILSIDANRAINATAYYVGGTNISSLYGALAGVNTWTNTNNFSGTTNFTGAINSTGTSVINNFVGSTNKFNGAKTFMYSPSNTNSLALNGALTNITGTTGSGDGDDNFGFGNCLQSLTIGVQNICIGNNSLNTIGSQNANIAIGNYALQYLIDNGTIAIGNYAARNIVSGGLCTFIGNSNAPNVYSGKSSFVLGTRIAEGSKVGYATDFDCNTLTGNYILSRITNTCRWNTATGFNSLGCNYDAINPSTGLNYDYQGARNTAFGAYAGYGVCADNNGEYNTFLGFNSGVVDGYASINPSNLNSETLPSSRYIYQSTTIGSNTRLQTWVGNLSIYNQIRIGTTNETTYINKIITKTPPIYSYSNDAGYSDQVATSEYVNFVLRNQNPLLQYQSSSINYATLGSSYTVATGPTASFWLDISISYSGKIQVAIETTNSKLWLSSDYGINWTNTYTPAGMGGTPSQVKISPNGLYGMITTSTDIYYSRDSFYTAVNWGVSGLWQACALNFAGEYAVAVIKDTTACVIRVWTDYFTNSYVAYSSTGFLFQDVAMSYSGRYITAVSYGYIYVSSDFGQSWTQSDAPNRYWENVSMSATGKFQTASINNTGLGGGIWRSQNYGVNWTISSASQTNTYSGVAICRMNPAYQLATTYSNTDGILRSSDYGATWSVALAGSQTYACIAVNNNGTYSSFAKYTSVISYSALSETLSTTNNTNGDYIVYTGSGSTFFSTTTSAQFHIGMSAKTFTGVNGILRVKATVGTNSIDGAIFIPYSDTNNIINFVNTAGTIRGSINGTSSTTVSYNTSSDRRLKKNIEPMPSQLENIKKLNARAFTWKETNQDDYGFIAQEIYSVYEHLRPYNKYEDKENPTKADGTPWIYGVDYGKMTPYLWAGLQELIYKVEQLENAPLGERSGITPLANKFIINDQLAISRRLKKQVEDQQQIINNQKQLIDALTLSNTELVNDVAQMKTQIKNIMNCLISKNLY